jgi:hypothetical protein
MTAGATWRIASASVVGTSHTKTGSPCQDNHACEVLLSPNEGPILAIAVSDGAGSASKAEFGSGITCSVLLEQIAVYLAEGRLLSALSEETAREWLDAVRKAISERAGDNNLAIRDYACTMLFAVVGVDTAVFIQIGDGAIVVSDQSKGWHCVFWPERGEFANTTFFVTDDHAADKLAFKIESGRINELALFTDGIEALVLHYASKAVHAPFFERMLPPVRQSVVAGLDAQLSKQLETYLSSPVIDHRTDDDKTLVLASRRFEMPSDRTGHGPENT